MKHDDVKLDKKIAAGEAKKAVVTHEKKLHKMAGGGIVMRGAGCATKGTKVRGPLA